MNFNKKYIQEHVKEQNQEQKEKSFAYKESFLFSNENKTLEIKWVYTKSEIGEFLTPSSAN